MYKELEKYKIDEKVRTTGVYSDGRETIIYLDGYEAGLGDLVEDFIEHKTKPFWKRKYYHNHLTKIYKAWLNEIKFKKGF
jgi:hypothetical protein